MFIWDIMYSSFVARYQLFRGNYCLHLKGMSYEAPPTYQTTVSHLRRL
jgi:hypothetical protein